MNDWPTKIKDIHFTEQLMEEFASQHQTTSLGLFEIITDHKDKQFEFRLSQWVTALASHFFQEYGTHQGTIVLRNIVSHCFIRDTTVH